MAEVVESVTTTIAAGQSLSAEVDIGPKSLVGLVLPANWSAAAGGISFQASADSGATWNELLTISGSPYAIAFTAAGGAFVAIDPAALRGVQSLKVRSGTSGAPVNQTNAVALTLLKRYIL